MTDNPFDVFPQNISESNTMNIVVGVENMAAPAGESLFNCSLSSYTLPSENIARSGVLDRSAVRVGDSVIAARVPESRIMRDRSEEI